MKHSVAQLATLAGVTAYDTAYPWTKLLSGPRYFNAHVGLLIDSAAKDVLVIPRGTAVATDGLKDLAAAVPYDAGARGWVPLGFDLGMQAVYEALMEILRRGWSFFIAGHSLGGSQALNLAGIFIANGIIPSGVLALEPAASGTEKLKALLAELPPGNLLITHNTSPEQFGPTDPVPDLPPWAFHPGPVTKFYHPPNKAIVLDLDLHPGALCATGVAGLNLPDFDIQPAVWRSTMTDSTASAAAVPATTTAVAVTTPAHAEGLAELGDIIAAGISNFLALFKSAAAAEQKALPTEVGLADVAEVATGNAALVPLTNAAAGAAETIGAAAAVNPTDLTGVIGTAGATLSAVQNAITAATGKPPSAQVVAATTALTAAAAVVAKAPSAPAA